MTVAGGTNRDHVLTVMGLVNMPLLDVVQFKQ
jgi:hypothetical protein